VVVSCPKCKTKLRVGDEKIKPEGTRFRCPKCGAAFRVARPQGGAKAPDRRKVLVAHEKGEVVRAVEAALSKASYRVLRASDGVDTLVKVLKELPFLLILDAALPKITGYEIARRLRGRPDTKPLKVVLVSSADDPRRVAKRPASAHGVNAYVEESDIPARLLQVLHEALSERPAEVEPSRPAPEPPPRAEGPPAGEDPDVLRAKRLARTVLSDIELYSPEKVSESIRDNTFQAVFAQELKEGLKHYESRIPVEVRGRGNFFQDAIDEFMEEKRRSLGIA
jgi:predicted Zn finger-like uncharacterized protein